MTRTCTACLEPNTHPLHSPCRQHCTNKSQLVLPQKPKPFQLAPHENTAGSYSLFDPSKSINRCTAEQWRISPTHSAPKRPDLKTKPEGAKSALPWQEPRAGRACCSLQAVHHHLLFLYWFTELLDLIGRTNFIPTLFQRVVFCDGKAFFRWRISASHFQLEGMYQEPGS